MTQDYHHMREALVLAEQAGRQGEVPIGALVVDRYGEVIGTGYNQSEHLATQAGHAEIIALTQAGKAHGDWRLTDCTLYVTVQPCLMCWGALALMRVTRLVYGTRSPIFGIEGEDLDQIPPIYKAHLRYEYGGVLSEQAHDLMQKFFESQRSNNTI